MLKPLSREEQAHAVGALKTWFEHERGEAIGELAAALLLDVVTRDIAPFYFNQGVRASRQRVEEAVSRLSDDLDVVEMPAGR